MICKYPNITIFHQGPKRPSLFFPGNKYHNHSNEFIFGCRNIEIKIYPLTLLARSHCPLVEVFDYLKGFEVGNNPFSRSHLFQNAIGWWGYPGCFIFGDFEYDDPNQTFLDLSRLYTNATKQFEMHPTQFFFRFGAVCEKFREMSFTTGGTKYIFQKYFQRRLKDDDCDNFMRFLLRFFEIKWLQVAISQKINFRGRSARKGKVIFFSFRLYLWVHFAVN